MTTLRTTGFVALAIAAAFAPLVAGGAAHAKGKDFYAQSYQFDRPMNGYEGFSGAYHCSYVKTPKNVCNKAGQCKRVWELLQTCQ
ncbi:hypothetical protein [uncultured Hyphomicrobium sp.]|uniref:hypothetical protein n=1 Tax=uncultured Hyphomicrobium sp. TaxID=194373 RepID=UPI0025E73295|nr:hypothetical protein [uncultured Hyphomicrobium sp.]